MENPISAPGFVCKNLCFGFKSKKGGGWPAHRGLAIHRDVILVNAAVHRTAAPSFACREACEAGTRFKSPIWQQAKRIPSPKGEGILFGPSVIIGFQKTQIYQRFAGSRQEVFILKIQNDESNAAQQDNGRRFHIEIKQKQGQYFLLFLFDSIELLLHHSLQKHPRLLLQQYSGRSV